MKNQTMGDKIKVAREAAHLSQEELASLVNLSQQELAQIEQNKTIPDEMMCEQLSKHLNVTKEALLGQNFKVTNQKITLLCYLATVALFMTQFVFVFLGISPGEAIVLALAPFFMSSTVFLVLTLALISNDYTMVAGYNHKIVYRKEAVRRSVSLIQAHVVRGTCFYFMLSLLLQKFAFDTLVTALFFCYLVAIVVGIFVISLKTQRSLYEDAAAYEQVKVQSVPTYVFIVSIIISLIVFIMVCSYFEIENGSSEILKLLILLLLNIFMSFGVSQYENRRLRKSEAKKYSFSNIQMYGLIGELGFILAMVISGFNS